MRVDATTLSVPVHNTISSNEERQTTLIPQLNYPKGQESDQELFEASLDITDLLILVILRMNEEHKRTATLHSTLMKQEHTFAQSKEQELLNGLQKVYTLQRLGSLSTKLNKAITPIALIAGGVLAAKTIPVMAAGGAIIFGAFTLLDTFLDDQGKKKLAEFLSRGNRESKEAWLSRLHFTSTVASLALSMAVNPVNILGIALQAGQAVATAGQTAVQYASNKHKANRLELQELSDTAYETIQKLEKELERVRTLIYDQLHAAQAAEKQRNECVMHLFV